METGVPYGEARRLRYFTLICQELVTSGSVDIDFLIEKTLIQAKKLNPKLKLYKRNTGIMRTRAVTRNYIRFCHWLGFLQLNGRLVVPNGFTVFIANIDVWEDFRLSAREKIGFFLRIIEKEEIRGLLASLRIKNRVKDYTPRMSEHFVESFFDWFVDLGILSPSSKTFGRFDLTHTGYLVRESLVKGATISEASRIFSSCVLRTPVKVGASIPNFKFQELLYFSLRRLAPYIRSELDPNLYSVLPVLLDLQLEVIVKLNQFLLINVLIKKLKSLSSTKNMVFSWDPLAKRGYLKVYG